jgi:N-acetylglucosaminyldiphosphoundecaprenol N-acetyl-beta-D-mannosaminyltransferase
MTVGRSSEPSGDGFVVMGRTADALTLEDAVERVATMIRRGTGGHVVTATADVLHQAERDNELRAVLDRADLVVADAGPQLWMARWQGTPLPARVNGTDLAVRLLEVAGEQGSPVCMLAGGPDATVRAAKAAADATA